jgi:hypothetical protein
MVKIFNQFFKENRKQKDSDHAKYFEEKSMKLGKRKL